MIDLNANFSREFRAFSQKSGLYALIELYRWNFITNREGTLSTPSKKAMAESAGKVMTSNCWYTKNNLLFDYFSKDQTIVDEYYASLGQIKKTVENESLVFVKKKSIIFYDDYTTP